MKYGHFDDNRREYVITNPRTPWPWINYLGNEDFFSLVSNTGGGYSFYKDAKFRRLTRYRYNNVPMDSGGKYFYINDGESVWSPGWKPCKTELAPLATKIFSWISAFAAIAARLMVVFAKFSPNRFASRSRRDDRDCDRVRSSSRRKMDAGRRVDSGGADERRSSGGGVQMPSLLLSRSLTACGLTLPPDDFIT